MIIERCWSPRRRVMFFHFFGTFDILYIGLVPTSRLRHSGRHIHPGVLSISTCYTCKSDARTWSERQEGSGMA